MDPITSFDFIPGVNLDDSRFSAAEIAAAEVLVQQAIQDRATSLEISKNSTLYDIQVRQQSILYLLNRAQAEALKHTQSLLGVIQNPELINDAVIDEILSNVLITRRAGSKSVGRIRINVSREDVYSVTTDTLFSTITGQTFSPTARYRALLEPVDAQDVKLYAADASGSQFYFIVPVESSVSGISSRLVNGTELSVSPSIPFSISIVAFGDFQGGADDESNADLIKRIPEGLSAKNQVSRTSISGSLKEAFSGVRSVSVQGMNDQAMSRNTNILSIRTGGYADIYVRSTLGINYGSIAKTATLIDIDETTSAATYSVKMGRDDFPGFYFTNSIRSDGNEEAGTFQVVSEQRSYNGQVIDTITGQVLTPNRLTSIQEATYTRYQTTEILFLVEYDPDLNTQPVDQFPENKQVKVEVAYQPLIAEIQDFFLDRDNGVVLADYLVRSIIPCFIEISALRVEGSEDVSSVDIQQALFTHINNLEPGSKLRTDSLVKIIRGLPGVEAVNLPIRLTGSIYAPDGQVLRIVSDSALEIPRRPDLQVIPETVAFFIELSSIPVALITI